MITIDIPAWLQYAALGLAIVYAVRKAMSAFVVAAEPGNAASFLAALSAGRMDLG